MESRRVSAQHRSTEVREIKTNRESKLFISQNGLCALCDRQLDKYVIDHDHATGKKRGLLCNACNVGLGMFQDTTSILERAIRYLDKHTSKP